MIVIKSLPENSVANPARRWQRGPLGQPPNATQAAGRGRNSHHKKFAEKTY